MTTKRRDISIEVFVARAGGKEPSKGDGLSRTEWRWWYWRIRWPNGKIAAVSEGYNRKAMALKMARKMADFLLVEVPVEQPVPPTAAPVKQARGRS